MEEKLYFTPASYGKGKKRSGKAGRLSVSDKKEKPKGNHKAIKLVSFLLVLAIIIIVIIWLLRGKTTTSGKYPEDVRNESFTCEGDGVAYQILGELPNTKKNLKISGIFKGGESLKSLSIIYTLYYDNYDEVVASEAVRHADMNFALSAAGFSPSKFNYKFSRFDSYLTLQLYATTNDIDEIAAPFLMIDTNDELKVDVATLDEYVSNYEAKGLSCKTTIEY